jgi:hypothetical protein
MDMNSVQVFLSVLLFVSLFLPDIWVLSNVDNDDDVILDTVSFVHGCGRARDVRRGKHRRASSPTLSSS